MLDMLRLMVPFKAEYCFQLENRSSGSRAYHYELNVEKVTSEAGFLGNGVIVRDDLGNIVSTINEFIPYQSIPSSFTGIALKFFNGSPNLAPHIELKASPTKIIQGHNIFGSNSILLAYSEFYASLTLDNPELSFMLDWDYAEALQLDCTFSARVDTEQRASSTHHQS